MINTRITQLFGIQYPIMCGGMQNAANKELAAAISEAGGLGITNVSMYPDFDEFREVLRWIRRHTGKPFAVNISMIPNVDVKDKMFHYIKICGEEGVNIIETAGKDPAELIPMIHDYGMLCVHKVPMPRHALRAEKSGADAVTIVGAEAAGHPSPDLIGTMVAVNKTARLCSIPVLSGGGICDGRSMAAALVLGAEGVVIGTRFLASEECCISKNHKQWIVEHDEKDTILCQKTIRNMVRVAHNKAAENCLLLEQKKHCLIEDLMPVIAGNVGKEAYATGNTEMGMFPVGQDIGLIDSVTPVREIIESMMREATERLRGFL